MLVFAVASVDSKYWDSPGVLDLGIEFDEIAVVREALTLRFDAVVVWHVVADTLAETEPKARRVKSLAVEVLVRVSVKAVAAQKIAIAFPSCIRVFRDEKTGRVAGGLPFRGVQRRHHTASALNREVVHQVVTQHSF